MIDRLEPRDETMHDMIEKVAFLHVCVHVKCANNPFDAITKALICAYENDRNF